MRVTRPGPGRPPAEDPRTERMMLRLTPAESELVNAAASLDDKTPSAWVRDVAVTAAERRIAAARGGK